MTLPAGLHVITRPAAGPGAPSVVLVHGSLDRAESFRRVMRRLPEVGIVAYDRRGYQGSRAAGVTDLGGHVTDLLAVVAEVRAGGVDRVSAVGHSLGGSVVAGAALAEPRLFDSIGAFEPPMPWLGFRPVPPGGGEAPAMRELSDDPAVEAELFFSRMVSPTAWQRLTEEGREGRRADGPALLADLRSMRSEAPFDITQLGVPAVFGMGGTASRPHHRAGVTWLGTHIPGASVFEIEGAQHGAHLSHPDHFAAFVRVVLALAGD